MSLMNLFASPDCVVLSVDTDAIVRFNLAGEPVEAQHSRCAKLFPFVHMPAVLAYRGSSVIPFTLISVLAGLADYDTIDANFADLAALLGPRLASENATLADTVNEESEIIIAGWSNQLGQMDAVYWHRDAGPDQPFKRSPSMRRILAPPPHEDPSLAVPTPRNLSDHVTLARVQAARLRAEPDSVSVGGGDLVVATLARDSISVECVRDFTSEQIAQVPQSAIAATVLRNLSAPPERRTRGSLNDDLLASTATLGR